MKKVILCIPLFTYLLIFSSCGSDDSDDGPVAEGLVGTWELTDVIEDGSSTFYGEYCSSHFTLQLLDDFTTIETEYDDNASNTGCISEDFYGTYQVNGNQLRYGEDNAQYSNWGEYTVSSTTLTITYYYLNSNTPSDIHIFTRVN